LCLTLSLSTQAERQAAELSPQGVANVCAACARLGGAPGVVLRLLGAPTGIDTVAVPPSGTSRSQGGPTGIEPSAVPPSGTSRGAPTGIAPVAVPPSGIGSRTAGLSAEDTAEALWALGKLWIDSAAANAAIAATAVTQVTAGLTSGLTRGGVDSGGGDGGDGGVEGATARATAARAATPGATAGVGGGVVGGADIASLSATAAMAATAVMQVTAERFTTAGVDGVEVGGTVWCGPEELGLWVSAAAALWERAAEVSLYYIYI